MREVPTTEFTRNFGRYREIVQREPVAVMSHGRATGYFVSALEYEDLQRYKNLAQKSFATKNLQREEVDAIASGRMSSEHDHLNDLMDAK
ncbi:type II toxin-antitoxin system Phd/YefM family antitoxin [Mesorhizobium sp. RCC_202]|uniref:type II toxin-antitoxin system Phd/YefM family antitoxin n=1 Tax=Mesorhizobium sp. RCC_202 TaxID=3239222 RepID=UPI0035232C59